MRILFVASEGLPFSKTGGLADVVEALPKALVAQGHEVAVVLPRYRGTKATAWRPFGYRSLFTLNEHDRIGGPGSGKSPVRAWQIASKCRFRCSIRPEIAGSSFLGNWEAG